LTAVYGLYDDTKYLRTTSQSGQMNEFMYTPQATKVTVKAAAG